MYFKIVSIVSLLTVCVAELAPNIHQPPTNHAISSMSFHRHDVPISYKYSSVHTHSTKNPGEDHKSHGNYHKNTPESNNFRSIQYAPLLKHGDLPFPSGTYTKMSLHSPHNLNSEGVQTSEMLTSIKKDRKPLEPRIEPKPPAVHPHPLSHLEYIPGHNIEVLRSVNRSPGHNAVYRSNPETSLPPIEKQKKINYLNQYIIYQPNLREGEASPKYVWSSTTEEWSSNSASTTTTTTKTPTKHPYISKPYSYGPKPYHSANLPPGVKHQLQKSPYTKMHALLLNVARAYNLALTPYKALHAGASPSVLGKNGPPQNLMRVPGSTQLQAPSPEQKTLLYPVQKNLHFAIHS